MTPDLPPVPPGRWLPVLEAAAALGCKERTVFRRVAQGRLQKRYDSRGHVQVYVPDPPDTRQDREQDTAMTLRQAVMTEIAQPFLQRNAEQEAVIRQQAEEIGTLRERLETATADHLRLCTEIQAAVEQRNAQLAAQATPWWRGLWARLSGRAP